MKKLLISFALIPFLFAFTEPTMTLAPSFNPIATAMGTGNADALSKFFDEDVEISISDKEDTYDKDKAKSIVTDFFSKNKPKSFNQVHQGQSKGKDTQYCIGEMPTVSGNYRVYLYMKVVSDQYIIQEIRFDKQ
jgi:Domain of unknown function (DUF4783)